MAPTTIGTPGRVTVGDKDAGRVGAVAEHATAKILTKAPAAVTVLHDLSIPGSPANIDHAVIVGSTVWLLDSKAWAPGWYVTLFGRTWRRWRPWTDQAGKHPGDKLTLPMARDRLARILPAGVTIRCRLVVHSSSNKRACRLAWYRPKGAKAWSPARCQRWVERLAGRPADPEIIAVLRPLVRTR